MYVWEMIACRLRGEGWSVWHTTSLHHDGEAFIVQLNRPGISDQATGPTLTDAYAAAARQARRYSIAGSSIFTPHFALAASAW
jgi:hypothetical protein